MRRIIMYNKNRDRLLEIIQDMDDFAKMKNIDYPPVYILGGSGCIIAGYLDRGTTDFDLLDMGYSSEMGRLLRILEKTDLLDLYLTTIPEDFIDRAVKVEGLKNVYVLSREDIILSKIGRYSAKDIEDISAMMEETDIALLKELIKRVADSKNISERVKEEFFNNLIKFRERFNV
jgi:hypothetical protein